jgi:uncharacterized protein (DUF2237 family)
MEERETRARRGAWSVQLGEAFLALLAETGNARASARVLGHRHLFNNRMRRDPHFRRACDAAVAAADARLKAMQRPFLPSARTEVKSMPPDGLPPPGPKRPRTGPEPVIRRTSNGRTQISHVREGFWTSEMEAEFLTHLRATGNFSASARAVGFDPTSLYKRLDKWPAFARDCKEALDEASARLDYRLVAHAHALLRRPGEPRPEGEDEAPFDPLMAMKILSFIDSRRAGRTGRGRRKGPPERSFEEARDSILRKIEAIERHEKLMKDRQEREGGG